MTRATVRIQRSPRVQHRQQHPSTALAISNAHLFVCWKENAGEGERGEKEKKMKFTKEKLIVKYSEITSSFLLRSLNTSIILTCSLLFRFVLVLFRLSALWFPISFTYLIVLPVSPLRQCIFKRFDVRSIHINCCHRIRHIRPRIQPIDGEARWNKNYVVFPTHLHTQLLSMVQKTQN